MHPRRSTSWRRARGSFALLLLTLSIAAVPSVGHAAVENPIVRGPVTGGIHGRPWFSSLYAVASFGYVEEEFFISGQATRLSDGASRPYTSRMVVRRPAVPTRFNGTLVAEWNNVTGGQDLETLWPSVGEWAMRQGFAFATVSAQIVGVAELKAWDPVRYATLVHPGDDYSFDIFSQAMAAVKHPRLNRTTVETPQRVDPMGGLEVRKVIAHGASQSAGRLTTYINGGYHAAARVADGFLITRGGGPYPNLDTPVINVNEEGNDSAYGQPDSEFFRFWQEAGIAHAPVNWYQYVWRSQSRDLAGTSPVPDAAGAGCSMNRGTSQYTHRVALYALDTWINGGGAPAIAPRITHVDGATARDADGHALGGIRYPFIAVPVAHNSASGCPLFGQYRPWSKEKIVGLYPTKDDYVSQVDVVVDQLLADGLMLAEDGAEARAEARAFDVWKGGTCFDTANRAGNESGPVSGQLHAQSHGLTTLGAPNALHEASCTVIAPAGL